MRAAALCLVALLAAACGPGGVQSGDRELYDIGYELGVEVGDRGWSNEQQSQHCITMADAMAEELGWSSDQRGSYVLGCQQGRRG